MVYEGRAWDCPSLSLHCLPGLRDLLAGRNEKGQLGHGDTKRVEAPRLIEALSHEAIVLAACGRNHTLALTGKKALPQLWRKGSKDGLGASDRKMMLGELARWLVS